MLHDLLCGDPLLWADLDKLGDQVLHRPKDGVEKLRVELVVGGDLSPVLKSILVFYLPRKIQIWFHLYGDNPQVRRRRNHNMVEKGVHAGPTLRNRIVIFKLHFQEEEFQFSLNS